MNDFEPVTIEFIDGYLTAMSSFCHGCNFVPFYGAEEIVLKNNDVKMSLTAKLGNEGYSNFQRLEQSSLLVLLGKWVGKRLFEGEAASKGIPLYDTLMSHNIDLLEYAEDLVSKKHEMYSFNISHRDYEMDTEALCFHGNDNCLFFYFGWSD